MMNPIFAPRVLNMQKMQFDNKIRNYSRSLVKYDTVHTLWTIGYGPYGMVYTISFKLN